VVGIGPGGPLDRTRRAERAISQSGVIVGYRPYLKLIEDLTAGKEVITTGMTQEVERCRTALDRTALGQQVAIISSGDPGIYGMAGLALEISAARDTRVDIEIIPGVSSASAAAAKMGAPLMCDFAVISLSDLLVPWETISARLEAMAAADLVTVIYNPRSKKRRRQLDEAAAIFRKFRPGETPVGVGTAVGTKDECLFLADLDNFLELDIGMSSIVIIGNRSSRCVSGWFITPRGYRI
jgi:precorrin-3B C17-methyltransferase